MFVRVGLSFVLTVAVLSCSSGSTLVSDAAEPVEDTAVPDQAAGTDVGITDVQAEMALPDLTIPDHFQLDLPVDLPPSGCLPGEGCFLDKCAENGDCLSGWCVEHMGEGVCSETCVDECPQGWSCKQVGVSDPDLVYVCVSDHSNLCKPCISGDSCKAAGGADDVCVDYGEGGAFCGGACVENQDCPWGFTCLNTQTVDGIETTQCVADTGSCPCTDKSVALALWTPCALSNEFGECAGKRICSEGGLQECDAAPPLEETCNGVDDDCDALVDEPDDVSGDFVPLCDDGNQCTADLCNGADGCDNQPLSEGECMDGDPCTAADHCEEGQCVGNPVLCDDNNPCTDDSCDGTGGCLFQDNSADCDDGNPCTVADECEDGTCAGTSIPCDCQTDEDCDAFEDNDLCNGTLACDNANWPYTCVVDASSVVVCPEPAPGPDALCLAPSCDPQTGACSLVPDHEGFPCDDQDLCSIGDTCQDGTCAAGVPANCKDDNPCTDDSCTPAIGCQFTANQGPCSDGDVCTTGDICSEGACLPGMPLICDDADLCNGTESCDPTTGCKPGVPLLCDDGDACNGQELCDPILGCQQADAPLCDDLNPCTDDSCNAQGGCQHTFNSLPCDDDSACTVNDACAQGACKGGNALPCSDDNICTDDGCDPESGCVFSMNEAPCNDDDLCTTGDHCHLGQCISSGTLICDDMNICTDDSCSPLTGCSFAYNAAPCEDNNACTEGDHCLDGWCGPGNPLLCDDMDECTDDWCDPLSGCKTEFNTAPCDDNDLCTAEDACSAGQCLAGVPVDCDDLNLCTDNTCVPDSGCVYPNNEAPCDDDNLCTVADVCGGGTCQPGTPLVCDDANPCTEDDCLPAIGCDFADVLDETDCAPDKWCIGGTCVDKVVPGNETFSYTGGQQTFVVPGGITQLTVVAYGAEAGNGQVGAAGKGGRIQVTLAVVPGETLYINVGEQGTDYPPSSGGWNGGGQGANGSCGNYAGGGGGGATDVRQGGAGLGDRVLVAGGGGGGGADGTTGGALYGGGGGGTVGQDGQKGQPFGGGCQPSGYGGTQAKGGDHGKWACANCNSTDGSLGQGGNGNTSTGCGGTCGGGGGGGGYYGGGGGGLGAGGGGSSYAGPGTSNVSHEQGVRTGNGEVTLQW